ncbi:hypothetical protein KCU90_g9830, partial [Aureobasidium melanogenum]
NSPAAAESTTVASKTSDASSAQSTNESSAKSTANSSNKDSSTTNSDASTTGSDKSAAASSGASQSGGSSDASTTGKSTANSSGSSKGTATTKSSKSKTYGVTAGYGGIAMITPNIYSSSSYYKVGDYVTFAWNMTSLSVTPTALDILASCAANQNLYTLAVNQTVNGSTGAVTWDTGNYQATATIPLLTETYTLIIMDAAMPAISATAAYGGLPVYSGHRFGMYTPQPYSNTSGNDTEIYTCVTCKSAASSLESQSLAFIFSIVFITIATYTTLGPGTKSTLKEFCSDHGSELNVNGLRLLDSEPPKSPTPVAVQNPTEPISSAKAEVVTDEQDRKPSKVLFVSGIGRGINIKHLFKEFADVCPVNVDFDTSKRVAVIEFTDIEAATKALKAKHGVFLNGRALNCEFGSESSLHDQVGIPTIASEQPTDDHRDDESPIPKEIVVNEQFGTPSKFLHVVGIAKSVNIEHLFEEFADVSPVDISHVGSWPYGFFEFTDIEAATKAIKAKHGTFLCCKKLKCMFSRSENPFTKSVGIRTVASKQPIDDHGDEDSSVPEPLKVGDTISAPTTITTDIIAVSTGTTVGTVAQVPEEIMKEFVGEAPTEITEEAVRYAPTQTVADELMLSSEPDPLDQTASLRKIPKRQRKVKKAKAAQSMIKEPAPSIESRLDKSVFETLSESIRDQAETTTVEPPGATSDDEPLYDGGLYNESASSSSIDQATFHDLEKDDLVYEDEPSSSDELQSKAHQELLREPGLKKGPTVDRILPEIRQYATIPVPRTRAYYLPYSSQNRVLSGLQASLEQVCFRYLQRKHPELLKETPTRWAIDSAHAFELNRYICLLGGLIAPSPGVDLGPGGSQSLQALIKSIAGQRHHAVHRFRVDIEALRFWAVDAVRLAELLEDPEAARQFSSLVSSLEAQQDRIKAEKMKAEEDLLITVRELAAKRAELLRVEREAMTAYEAAHKQLPTRTS